MKTNIYNIETRIGTNGEPYIMELTPRGGGNRLCEMLHYATGVDMITAMTRYIVGDSLPIIEQKPYNGHWAEVILHADKSGIFDHLEIASDLPAEVVEEDLPPGFICANAEGVKPIVLRLRVSSTAMNARPTALALKPLRMAFMLACPFVLFDVLNP